MATKTGPSIIDLAIITRMNSSQLSTHWPLINPRIVNELKNSGGRTVYEVRDDNARYILKRAGPSKNSTAVMKDAEVFVFLNEAGFPAPTLIKTVDGATYAEEDTSLFYLLSYIDGSEPDRNVVDYAGLGELTARLHTLEGYGNETEFTAAAEVPRMIKRAERFDIDPRYIELVNDLPDFSALPKCLIHTDIGAQNALKEASGQIVLIDWDDAGIGTRILDLGFPLICDFVSKDLVFDADRARAFYSSYAKKVALTDAEKSHLFDAGMLYALSYTIFDDSGFVEDQWNKVLYALDHKDDILQAAII